MISDLGAHYLKNGDCSFVVWAPFRREVVLQIISPRPENVIMRPAGRGYFEALLPAAPDQLQYQFLLDGELLRPDPASGFQPVDVHGPSQAVRHDHFPWSDQGWRNPPLHDYLIYELHVGTFTPEGTFETAAARLPYLQELGITALEIMPVAQFPGDRNWGYDGAYPYAVQNSYGGPDGLKTLVDACHRAGLAVILDVVYNHLGPEGNYLCDFGPYFTDRYHSPWGMSMNFDGPHSDEVRRFFIDNALHWIERYHIDALRLDAVHAIFDFSARHILAELKEAVSTRASRPVYLIAESDLNDVRLIQPPFSGGYGLEAQWMDDFHHALHALLTGEALGYYMDFGSLSDLATALREGFVYGGRYSAYRQRRYGNSSQGVPPERFVVCSQNHDQVGNRMLGDRLSSRLEAEQLKLAAALVLLSPYIPLLFMGEEYGETAPFQYFVSHLNEHLIEAVREGRKKEFAAFAWEGEVPDPQDEATFRRSKINPELRQQGDHREIFAFYRELIRLRRHHPTLRQLSRQGLKVEEKPEQRLLTLQRSGPGGNLFYVANFGSRETRLTPGLPGRWRLLLDSRHSGLAAKAEPAFLTFDHPVRMPGFAFHLYEQEQ